MGFFNDKYRSYKDAKSGRSSQFSDEDIQKYTGRSRAELGQWASNTPGVGRWQGVGSMMAGGSVSMGMHEMPSNVKTPKLKFGPEWEERERAWQEQHRKDLLEAEQQRQQQQQQQ